MLFSLENHLKKSKRYSLLIHVCKTPPLRSNQGRANVDINQVCYKLLGKCEHRPNLYYFGLDKDPNYDLDMVIDIHSHVSLLGLFIVGNSYDDVYRFERHVVFPKIMVGGFN